MIFALLTVLFFGVTPVLAVRSARLVGPGWANLGRLLVAAFFLGGWAHFMGTSVYGPSFVWFLLGGVVGFGIGGVAMFQSLVRLGPNVSNLIVQCVSVLAAASVEWLWLGTGLTPLQGGFALLAVTGIALGLIPGRLPQLSRQSWVAGIAWSLLSAAAQGTGAVLSRKAFQVARSLGEQVDPGTAAYERVLGGILVALLALSLGGLVAVLLRGKSGFSTPGPGVAKLRSWYWVCGNALTGPILGVTFYQWALRGNPAGVVQAIVATAPLLTVPLAAWIDGERPRPLYHVGASLAVGAIALLWLYA